MAQTLALYARRPEIDLGGIMGKAASLKQADASLQGTNLNNQLASMKLEDYGDERSALSKYRMGLKSGDPNAADELKGYPELQAQFHKTFESMKPDEKDALTKRTRSIAEDARLVSSLPKGSPEQKAAWDRVIQKNLDLGYISQEQHDSAIATGPSDLLLNQALTAEQWLDGALKQGKKALTVSDRLAIERLVNDYSKSLGLNTEFMGEDRRKEGLAKLEEYRTAVERRVSEGLSLEEAAEAAVNDVPEEITAPTTIKPSEGNALSRFFDHMNKPMPRAPWMPPEEPPAVAQSIDPELDPGNGGDGDEGFEVPETHLNAVQPKTQEEFDALAPGTPFINPADGRPLWKK